MKKQFLLYVATLFTYVVIAANFMGSHTNKVLLTSRFYDTIPEMDIQDLGIEFVFSRFNVNEIKSTLENPNDIMLTAVANKNALLISKYLKEKNIIDTDEDVEHSSEAILVFALFQLGKEKNLSEILENDLANYHERAPGSVIGGTAFDCLVGAIGSLIGLGEVRTLYNDYLQGVTPRTILRTLRTMVRRVGSVFIIISAVYGFGDCVNWW